MSVAIAGTNSTTSSSNNPLPAVSSLTSIAENASSPSAFAPLGHRRKASGPPPYTGNSANSHSTTNDNVPSNNAIPVIPTTKFSNSSIGQTIQPTYLSTPNATQISILQNEDDPASITPSSNIKLSGTSVTATRERTESSTSVTIELVEGHTEYSVPNNITPSPLLNNQSRLSVTPSKSIISETNQGQLHFTPSTIPVSPMENNVEVSTSPAYLSPTNNKGNNSKNRNKNNTIPVVYPKHNRIQPITNRIPRRLRYIIITTGDVHHGMQIQPCFRIHHPHLQIMQHLLVQLYHIPILQPNQSWDDKEVIRGLMLGLRMV